MSEAVSARAQRGSARAPLVVGLGQLSAGDDGAGLCVIDELERRGYQRSRLRRARDASALLELFASGEQLIVVDAALVDAERVGDVIELGPDELQRADHTSLSSHGVSVAAALELARTLYPEASARLGLVAIGIERPTRLEVGLSAAVSAAISSAADRVERMSREWELSNA